MLPIISNVGGQLYGIVNYSWTPSLSLTGLPLYRPQPLFLRGPRNHVYDSRGSIAF